MCALCKIQQANSISAYGPGCVKTLRGITAPGILGPTVMRRAKKRKNLSSAPKASVRCDAAIRPELGVKLTCQNNSTDAIEPKCDTTGG